MRATKGRVGFAMVMAWLCFGCKSMGALGEVATAAVVVTTRVVAETVVEGVKASGGGSGVSPNEKASSRAGRESDTASSPGLVNHGYDVPAAPPGECVELAPSPEAPADKVWLRTVDCGGHLLVQDGETGVWRPRRASR